MSKPVESLMVEMETECKAVAVANAPRGVGGSCERTFAGVEFCVRTGGAGLIWTRDNKRVSRKTAAEQIRELIESLETDTKAATAVPQLEELKEAETKGANAYESGDSLICCNPFPEGSARASAWAQGWRAEQADQHAKKAGKAAASVVGLVAKVKANDYPLQRLFQWLGTDGKVVADAQADALVALCDQIDYRATADLIAEVRALVAAFHEEARP